MQKSQFEVEIGNWFKNFLDSKQMLIVEETFLNVCFHKWVDESWCLCDSLFEESEEFLLVFRSCWLKSHLVADSIKEFQCEKFIEWWFTVWLNFVQNLIEDDSVDLIVYSVVGFLAIENVHDAFFVHFIETLKDFFMYLIHPADGNTVIDICGVDLIDADRDLSEFKEGEFIEVFLGNSSDNISEEYNLFSRK